MRIIPRAVKVADLPKSLSFSGQAILITGGNSGLGLAAAIHYVQRGASTVIITTRNAARGAEARETIESITGRKGIVQVRILDMNTFASVKDFVDGLKKDVKSIDIVLLNAGCIEVTYIKSPDGWESDLQINTLSTTLLSLLLLPWMRSIQHGRQHLTIVGSSGHREVDILASSFPKHQVLKYWNDENNYQPTRGSYQISKLLLHYAALEIAKLAEDADGRASPIINTVCPGPVKTSLARRFENLSVFHQGLVALFTLRSLSPEEGARALVLATTTTPAENGKFVTAFISDDDYAKSAAKNIINSAGKNIQAEVWKEILDILVVAVPEVKNIISRSE